MVKNGVPKGQHGSALALKFAGAHLRWLLVESGAVLDAAQLAVGASSPMSHANGQQTQNLCALQNAWHQRGGRVGSFR